MKKFFEMPAIELTKFDVEDVITTSTITCTADGSSGNPAVLMKLSALATK